MFTLVTTHSDETWILLPCHLLSASDLDNYMCRTAVFQNKEAAWLTPAPHAVLAARSRK